MTTDLYIIKNSQHDALMATKECNCFMPFKNINKKSIRKLYATPGVLDDIFSLAQSCKDFTSDLLVHCSSYWVCKERKWAFNRLT